MQPRIGVFGAGAVGGYVGAHMSLSGIDVTLIGQWAEHVDCIRREGLRIEGTQGARISTPKTLHLHEVQSLWRNPLDVVFFCVKSYDTAWAATMMSAYLSQDGYMVSMQNGMNEATIAAVVGWDRTLGVVLNTIGVESPRAGLVTRTTRPGGESHAVFRVGEPDGTLTARAHDVARMLRSVDSAEVTGNLMGERWSKLTANSISHGLSAVTGLNSRELLGSIELRRLTVRLAAEGIAVGQALGFSLVNVYGAPPSVWSTAALGDASSCAQIDAHLRARMNRLTETGRPSVAQDILRGRRTEIDFTNGHIVAEAKALAMSVPNQEAVLALVHRVERGEIAPGLHHIADLA